MDFKVAGTNKGITAIQMDTKIKGLSDDIIKDTFKHIETSGDDGFFEILNDLLIENYNSSMKIVLNEFAKWISDIKTDKVCFNTSSKEFILEWNTEKLMEKMN